MVEKVSVCHPDKVADRIAGALVDLAYAQDKNPKIAVEVLIGHGVCHIIAETSVKLNKKYTIRKLTPEECEKLQALPDNYTQYGIDEALISDAQRYKCLGNGWTVDVISHILNHITTQND